MTATGVALILLAIFMNLGRDMYSEPGGIQTGAFLVGIVLSAAGVVKFLWDVMP